MAVAAAAVGDGGGEDASDAVDGADAADYGHGHGDGSPYYFDADGPSDSNLHPF